MSDRSSAAPRKSQQSRHREEMDPAVFSEVLKDFIPQQNPPMKILTRNLHGKHAAHVEKELEELRNLLMDRFLGSSGRADKTECGLAKLFGDFWRDNALMNIIQYNRIPYHCSEHLNNALFMKLLRKMGLLDDDTIDEFSHGFCLHYLGSFMDGLNIPALHHKKHRSHVELPDVDTMIELSWPLAPHVLAERSRMNDRRGVLIMDGHGCHPGYTRLKVRGDHRMFYLPNALVDDRHGQYYLSNNVMLDIYYICADKSKLISMIDKLLDVRKNGPALSINIPFAKGVKYNYVITGDFVCSFPCNYWPCEANEWLVRERPSGWPGREQIDAAKAYGCHLVPIANPGNRSCRTEWRISFAVTERRLAFSFNTVQRHIYRIIKLIHKERLHECGVLSSYHLKTTLFWLCERIPQDSWTNEKLSQLFFDYLDRLLEFLSNKFIPNYFIPENNMIHHMDQELVDGNVDILRKIRQDPLPILMKISDKYDLHLDVGSYLLSKSPLRVILELGQSEIKQMEFEDLDRLGAAMARTCRTIKEVVKVATERGSDDGQGKMSKVVKAVIKVGEGIADIIFQE